MSDKKRLVIAIDGPAGAGKSTAARRLAEALGYVLVDTGALYRGVALAAREAGVHWDDGAALGPFALSLALEFNRGPDGTMMLSINGRDRSGEIRTPEISMGASDVSKHAEVRAALLELQRRLGQTGGVVLEGRDIGTVVFPNADLKVYLTASDEARATRRMLELESRGTPTTLEDTLREIRARDHQDSSREVAPLKPASDSVLLDTTGMDLETVVGELVRLSQSRGA